MKSFPILLPLTIARLIGLGSASIWYDEAFSVFAARLPLNRMLTLLANDYTPPLWELIIHPLAWGPLWLVRLPAALFSIGAAWLAFDLAGRKNPVLFTTLALLPGLLWHAQDARSYALLSFLYLLAAWMAIRGRWLGLTAACGLILWTHATGAAFVAGALALAFYCHPRRWKAVLLCGLVAGLSFLPWAPAWLLNGMSGHWIPPLTLNWFAGQTALAFWTGTLINGWLPLLFFLALLTVSLCVAVLRIRNAPLTSILFLVPLTFLLVVSIFFRDIFMYRTLTPFLLPLGLWLVETLDGATWTRRLVTAGWVLLVACSLVDWNPSNRGAGLEQAARNIAENWQAGDVLYYATGSVGLPFAYYLPDLPAFVMGGEQHAGLGKPAALAAFGLERADLSNVAYQRAWLIYPLDPLLTTEQSAWLDTLAGQGQVIARLDYIQAADILVVLVEK